MKITIFKTEGQFLLTPAVGFVAGEYAMYLTLAWMLWGISFVLYEDKD